MSKVYSDGESDCVFLAIRSLIANQLQEDGWELDDSSIVGADTEDAEVFYNGDDLVVRLNNCNVQFCRLPKTPGGYIYTFGFGVLNGQQSAFILTRSFTFNASQYPGVLNLRGVKQ